MALHQSKRPVGTRVDTKSVVSILSLVAAAGSVQAATFTFSATCNSNWNGTCTTTNGCGAGVDLIRNNWGLSSCAVAPAQPGATDDVVFPVNGTINTLVPVRSILVNGGVTVTINSSTGYSVNSAGGFAFTNNGTVQQSGGNESFTGNFINNGTYNEDTSGWTRFLNGTTFTNNGIANFQGSVIWSGASGVNQLVNEAVGAVNKTTNGSFTCNIPFTNRGTISCTGGTLNVNGTTFAADSGSTVNATGGVFELSNCTLSNAFAGLVGSATGSGIVRSTGTLTTPAPGSKVSISGNGFTLNSNLTINGPFQNSNVLSVTAGSKTFGGNSITNNVGAVWTDDNAGWTRTFATCAFNNNGTLNLPGSVIWTDTGGFPLTNTAGAVINKTAGGQSTVDLPIINNGSIAIAANGGTFRAVNTSYQGTGTVTVGTNGSFILENATIGGTINGTNSGATFRSTGTLSVPGPGATLNVGGTTGFQINSNISSGPFRNSGRVIVEAGDRVYTNVTFTNDVGATWTDNTAGWTRTFTSSSFTNNGTIELPGSVIWNTTGGLPFTNAGVINKSAGGQFTCNLPLNSTGQINVASGGGTFRVQNTSFGSSGMTTVNGGEVLLNDILVNGVINATVNTGGSFRTTGTLSFPGAGATINVQGLGMTLNGNLGPNPMNNAGIVQTAPGNQTYTNTIINNNGIWTDDVSGWTRAFSGATFNNNNTLNFPGSVVWNPTGPGGSLVNNATINKISGGSTNMNIPLVNNGLVNVANGTFNAAGGTTQNNVNAQILVRGGTNYSGAAFTIGNGRVDGRGTINQSVTNAGGIVSAGEDDSAHGTLTIGGNYTQQSGATFEFSMDADSSFTFDKLQVNGNASLDGTLVVKIVGNFIPVQDDEYEILRTNGTRTGLFGSVIVDGPPEVQVSVSYTSNSAILKITDTTCDSLDFNRDEVFPDLQDLIDYITVYGSGPCPTAQCGDLDFNNDGVFPDSTDIQAFIRVFGAGPCEL